MKMDVKMLARALGIYDREKRILDPARYVQYDYFRNCIPELYGDRHPWDPEVGIVSELLTRLLRDGRIPEDEMLEKLGFGQAELESALRDADPVIKPVPDRLVLMTFDDATIDHYERACPVLEQYGGRANLMIAEMEKAMDGSNFSDKSKYMTWEQIRELSDRGHEVCNHSWHHSSAFSRRDDEFVLAESRGIEERCAAYGIPKPITFGYPIGRCTPRVEEILREEGYVWGRGDLHEVSPRLLGNTLYDPYVDSPMVIPGVMFTDAASIETALKQATGGKIVLTVYHNVADQFGPLSYEEQVQCIYDNGGQCVTFRDLLEYIDPEKAYIRTHRAPALPESGPGAVHEDEE